MSIIASAANDLKFHQWPNGVIQQTYVPAKFDEGPIKSISWGRDGSWVIVVPSSGPTEIISIRDNIKLLQTVEQVCHPTCAIFQNGTKKNIAIGTLSGQVVLYDIKARNVRKRFPRTTSTIFQLKYNSKDSHLAAACNNGDILVYNNTTSSVSSSFRVPDSDSVSTINFHRTKRNLLCAGSDEGIVAAWDTNTSAVLCNIPAHQAPITSLSFSPIRSDLLVTGGLDRRFTFYDLLARKCILEVEVSSSITALDFSNCGTYLGLGSQNGTIVLYDTRNFVEPVNTFMAHEGKKIRHLLFQKLLLPSDQKNNSTYDITVHNLSRKEQKPEINKDTMDSLQLVTCNQSGGLEQPPQPKNSSDVIQDSFLAALDMENTGRATQPKESSDAVEDSFLAALGMENTGRVSQCETTAGLGITSEVRKWMDTTSKHSVVHKSHLLEQLLISDTPSTSSTNTKKITSTPKFLTGDLATSPPTASPIDTIMSTSKLSSKVNQISVSPEELKKVVREVIKDELASHMEAHKAELKESCAEILGHVRRQFLDLQMTIVKEFVALEDIVEKVKKNNSTKEFICDDFLINQNHKLIKELDSLKEQMVERDSFRKF